MIIMHNMIATSYIGVKYEYFIGQLLEYQKKPQYCNGRDQYGGTFSSLTDAQSACTADVKCRGVVDAKCNNSGFKLCPLSVSIRDQYMNSCFYVKGIKIYL